jgi:hypothetical protein
MMFRRLQKQLHDTELGTGSGTTGTRTCTYVQVQWGYIAAGTVAAAVVVFVVVVALAIVATAAAATAAAAASTVHMSCRNT